MKYDNKSITVAGAELLSQDLANKQSTIIEQMVVSDKQPADLSNIPQLTLNDFADALYYPVPIIHHQENTFQPSGLITNDNVVVTDANKGMLTNIQSNNGQQVGDLANNYDIQMVGLVGHTDGQTNNTLVAVAIADQNEAFTIPANTDIPYQLFFDMAVGYSNAANVIVNINNAGYITQADLLNTLQTYVSIGDAQVITGDKSFTGKLQYKGSEVATLSDVAQQYQNAVNTATSLISTALNGTNVSASASHSNASSPSSTSSNNNSIPSWIPAGAIELPNGSVLDGGGNIGQWYYIRPLNVSGYTYQDMPTGQYTLDPGKWYILRNDTGFSYNGTNYYNGGGNNTWVFNENGFWTEASNDNEWSNTVYNVPQPQTSNNNQQSVPTWMTNNATQLPYGTNLSSLPSSDRWYYIQPNTLSNYTNLPTGQYALDNSQWYILNWNVNQTITYLGKTYNKNYQVYIFGVNGPVTETAVATNYWSNNF